MLELNVQSLEWTQLTHMYRLYTEGPEARAARFEERENRTPWKRSNLWLVFDLLMEDAKGGYLSPEKLLDGCLQLLCHCE